MVNFRRYEPGDESQIIELLNLVFNGWPHIDFPCESIDYWRWKYLGREEAPLVIWIAEDKDQIIGCLHALPIEFKGIEGHHKYAAGMDYAVHPNYRGKGIGSQLSEHINPYLTSLGYLFTLSITGNPKLIKSMSKDHYPLPGKVLNYVWIDDVEKQLQEYPMDNPLIVKNTYKILQTISKIGTEKPYSNDLFVKSATRFGDENNDFWETIEKEYCFAIRRSSDYLNWKYCDPRVEGFQIGKVFEDGNLVGYIVFKANRVNPEYPVGYIVELVALSNRPDIVSALVGYAMDWFTSNDVNIVNFQEMEKTPYFAVMKRYGFVNSRIKLNILLKLFIGFDELQKIIGTDLEHMMITWGDQDVLPVKLPSY